MKALVFVLAISGLAFAAQAEETMTEKAGATVNSAKRSVKKGMNKTGEAMCGKMTGDSKMECMAKQAKNRVQEGTDTVKDKATEIKNNVDSDKKE